MISEFEFRTILPEEGPQTAKIECLCFPPNEALPEQAMIEKAEAAPDLFLVAVDKKAGQIAGFLNGLASEEEHLRDEFYTNAALHNPSGKNILLLGLEVRPEYRGQGLAGELMRRYAAKAAAEGREKLILTCVEDKVQMYRKMGFTDCGISESKWGGVHYHEMVYELQK